MNVWFAHEEVKTYFAILRTVSSKVLRSGRSRRPTLEAALTVEPADLFPSSIFFSVEARSKFVVCRQQVSL